MSPVETAATVWTDVCALDDILPDRGVCALIGGQQVAVFRVSPDDQLYALSNYDPFSKAFVLSRGIVGSADAAGGLVPKVSSPIYKQSFDLRTGACLTDPSVVLPTYPVRAVAGRVQTRLP